MTLFCCASFFFWISAAVQRCGCVCHRLVFWERCSLCGCFAKLWVPHAVLVQRTHASCYAPGNGWNSPGVPFGSFPRGETPGCVSSDRYVQQCHHGSNVTALTAFGLGMGQWRITKACPLALTLAASTQISLEGAPYKFFRIKNMFLLPCHFP